MLKRSDEKLLKEFLEERKKWQHFFEIIKRPSVIVGLLILLLLIDHFMPLHEVIMALLKHFTGMK